MTDSTSFQQAIFVQMFRRWAAAREAQVDGRLAMAELYRGPGTAIMAAVACDSLFELVEAQLARGLVPGRCCDRTPAPRPRRSRQRPSRAQCRRPWAGAG